MATEFIETHSEAAVFLDCGLGKTVVTLTAIESLMFDRFEIGSALVIAPLRVARDTWPAEIAKWDHLADLTYSVAVGTEAERIAALKAKACIHIINRENVKWLLCDSGLPFEYDMVVIDELSSFKSSQAQRFRALAKARPKVRRIVGLTGTPSSNGLMDLWAEFRVLDMGQRLGRYISQYRLRYFTPDRRNAQAVFSYRLLPGAEQQIYRAIGDITISMRAADHLKMPERIETCVEVELSPEEQERYRMLKEQMVIELDGEEITAANAAALAGKLCQMANGAVYADEGGSIVIHGRKLDALDDLVESACGRPMLLAYWYRHDLERIRQRLLGSGVSFSCLDSPRSMEQWNRGELQVGLVHPASAGHGLNLQDGGSRIAWFGLPWSLELYQQTNARLWRQGQKDAGVVIQRIVARGTIDERIIKALEGKARTQDALMDAVKAELGRK